MAKEKMMIQIDLESTDGKRILTTWVENNTLITEGRNVKLEDEDDWMKITKVYKDLVVPKSQLGVRGFKNNI